MDIDRKNKEFIERKDSNDSGIVADDDLDESVTNITKADFSCQHLMSVTQMICQKVNRIVKKAINQK
jgi:hypothetical protein